MLKAFPLKHPDHKVSAAGGAAPITSKRLPQFMQIQTQTNWCWSACGTSVGLLFVTGQWTQCGTACGCLNRTDCCDSPVPGGCNVYGYLDQALTFTKSFDKMTSGTMNATNIRQNIDAGKPVCARVAWTNGGAHFVAITGYFFPTANPSNFTIFLQDSIWGASSMLLADFPARYQGGGTWTHTYTTAKTA
ncbi:MAG: hypothetical protein IPK82_28805 [Polyangiaceae bacterium]|nr:hypothetical protein [Polyangiaceae bacterium]